VQLVEVLSADERAMLDAEAPPEDPAREARWKLAVRCHLFCGTVQGSHFLQRTLGKDALDERAGNRQLISVRHPDTGIFLIP
jgi:hypothetical protein